MGNEAITRSDEDELCALHLRNRLEGRPGNPAAVRDVVLAGGDVLRFHDPTRPYLNERDVTIALDVDRYDFAIRVTMEGGLLVARRERPEQQSDTNQTP
jgi:2-phosphosulfolactate phosphatase